MMPRLNRLKALRQARRLFWREVLGVTCWAALSAAIVSCSILPHPQTFNEKYAAAVTSATVAISTTDHLLVAGKLTKQDAINVEKQIDNVKEALDIAHGAYEVDQATGINKLTAAVSTLDALTQYLTKQQGK